MTLPVRMTHTRVTKSILQIFFFHIISFDLGVTNVGGTTIVSLYRPQPFSEAW